MSELVKKDEQVYVLSPDFGFPKTTDLIKNHSSHLINTSITEQATVGLASGMALSGLKPYVISIVPFLLERAFEQIKLDIVEQNANVKLIGYWDYPTAGVTHFTKDVEGLCRILGIKLYRPESPMQTRSMLSEAYESKEPAFFYLAKSKTPK